MSLREDAVSEPRTIAMAPIFKRIQRKKKGFYDVDLLGTIPRTEIKLIEFVPHSFIMLRNCAITLPGGDVIGAGAYRKIQMVHPKHHTRDMIILDR